jgi:hypothetical protein
MKITRKDIRELIYKEVFNSLNKNDYKENNYNQIEPTMDLNKTIDENFDAIEDKNLLKESQTKIEELKNINKEISRMKQLVDFRSPLLSKDSL